MEKKTILFVAALFLLLILRLFSFYFSQTAYKEGDLLSFTSTHLSQPKIYQSYQVFSLESPKGDLIYVKTKLDKEYNYGDKLNVSGNLSIQLLRKNKLLTLNFPQISLVKSKNEDLLAVNILTAKC